MQRLERTSLDRHAAIDACALALEGNGIDEASRL